MRSFVVVLAPLLALALVCATGCGTRPGEGPPSAPGKEEAWYAETRELYHDIPVTLKFSPADAELAAEAWAYLESIDDVLNSYRDDSEVGRINAAAERSRIEVSRDLAEALRISMDVHSKTDGAFDVTVGPVIRLWKAAAREGKEGKFPTPDEIARARAACGLDRVRLEGETLTIDSPDLRFDFGGIVKGIAVDNVVAMLKAAGVRAALVQIGGETAAFGTSMRGKPHEIGVQHPLGLPGNLWTAVVDPGTGLSCATSGNYQQPVVIAGRVFYHIVDPRTGRPVDTHTLSVTVAFPQTGRNGLADGLTTAGAVLGHERALPLVERLGGEALFIVREPGGIREYRTPGWDALVRKE